MIANNPESPTNAIAITAVVQFLYAGWNLTPRVVVPDALKAAGYPPHLINHAMGKIARAGNDLFAYLGSADEPTRGAVIQHIFRTYTGGPDLLKIKTQYLTAAVPR